MATKDVDLSQLKVAIVPENLTIRGGAEKVVLEIYKLFPHATIFSPLYNPKKFPELKSAKVVTSWLNAVPMFRKDKLPFTTLAAQQLLVPLMPMAFGSFNLNGYDLVISISTSAAKGAKRGKHAVHICYCNTPMRWGWMPELDPRASSSLLRRMAGRYMKWWDIRTIDRVDHWIANSHTIAARIKKFYNRNATVIYPPVNTSVTPGTLSGDYFLSVGRLEYIKRVDILIDAAIKTGVKLKIVGRGDRSQALKEQAKGHDNIEILGFVSDEERNELYQNCKAFLFASEEDFGIVPVEAMAFGKPVIAYGVGGASESVIDGKTGLHFKEQTAESLVSALERFDTMTFSSKDIVAHAQKFSEEAFAHNLTSFISRVLHEKNTKASLS